jgi:hypothetical protein
MAPAALPINAASRRLWPRASPKTASLEQCLALALLLHVLLIMVIGSRPGGDVRSVRGAGSEGSLSVMLRGTRFDESRGLVALPDAAEKEAVRAGSVKAPRMDALPAKAVIDAPAAPKPMVEVPATENVAPPIPNAPDPLPRLTSPEADAPTTPGPPLPILQTDPQPAELHVPAVKPAEAKAAPVPVPAAIPAQVEPEVPLPPRVIELSPPVVDQPAQGTAPTIAPKTLAPVEEKPTVTTSPVAAPTPEAPQNVPARAAQPQPSPSPAAGPSPIGDSTVSTGATPNGNVPQSPAQPIPAPSGERPLNLELHPKNGPMQSKSSMGLFPVMPLPPDRKSKLADDIDKSGKSDCKTAYSGAGLLAVIPLAVDAVREKGCRW